MLDEGRTGICCSRNGARSVIGILRERPMPIFRQQGHNLILQVVDVRTRMTLTYAKNEV